MIHVKADEVADAADDASPVVAVPDADAPVVAVPDADDDAATDADAADAAGDAADVVASGSSELRLIKYFRESPLQLLLRSSSFSLPPQKLSHTASVAAICHEPTHTKDTTTPRNVLE